MSRKLSTNWSGRGRGYTPTACVALLYAADANENVPKVIAIEDTRSIEIKVARILFLFIVFFFLFNFSLRQPKLSVIWVYNMDWKVATDDKI